MRSSFDCPHAMKPLIACLLLLSSFGIRPSAFAADSPQLIPFQGTLVNSAGTAYPNGQYAITFAIYNEAVGGSPVWTERHEKVGVINGTVNVFLGSINSFLKTNWSDNVNFGTTKYLGITVDADGNPATADKEMSPRQIVLTTFYAPTTDKLQDYGWNVLFGNQNPNTSTFQLTKIPSMTVDKLPQIPGSKLEANVTSSALAAANQSVVPTGGIVFSESANNTALANAGYANFGSAQVGEGWRSLASPSFLSGRDRSVVVWTGAKLLVFGGMTAGGRVNDGGVYDIATDTSSAMSLSSAPSPRSFAQGVWTGTVLIVWGGVGNAGPLADGAIYDPATNSWTVLPSGPLTSRSGFAMVWTGSECLIWGGVGPSNAYRNDGARLKLVAGSWTWTSMSSANAPSSRSEMSHGWTGSEMLIWAGYAGASVNSGARYNPTADSWTVMSTSSAPSARTNSPLVWTGTDAIVWGGYFDSGQTAGDGARYRPSTNSWTSLPTAGAPTARARHAFVWTGTEVLVWGGSGSAGGAPFYSDTARYNPATDAWTLSSVSGPPGRWPAGTAWNGQQLLVFGGYDASAYFNDLATYTLPRTLYLYQKQ